MTNPLILAGAAAAGYLAARGRGGRRGTRYDASEWIYFFSDPGEPTAEAQRLRPLFTKRIEYLLDNKFNLPDEVPYPDLDDLAHLSYASIVGHGVGLWEDREPWHSRFEKVVEGDKQANSLAYRLDEEFSIATEEGEGEANRGRRSTRGHRADRLEVSVHKERGYRGEWVVMVRKPGSAYPETRLFPTKAKAEAYAKEVQEKKGRSARGRRALTPRQILNELRKAARRGDVVTSQTLHVDLRLHGMATAKQRREADKLVDQVLRGSSARGRRAPLLKRQIKELEKMLRHYREFCPSLDARVPRTWDDLAPQLRDRLRRIKDQKDLHTSVDRWLDDQQSPVYAGGGW